MPSRFQEKLREIRDASTRSSSRELERRSDEELARSQRTVEGFEFREKVEAVIEEFVKNFQEAATGFVLNRGFFEGKYMLALRLTEEVPDADGNVDRAYSRLMFLLGPNPESHTFSLQCRKTIRNRDQESMSDEQPMDRKGLRKISGFVESQFLAFASKYFGDKKNSEPQPTVET